MPRPVIAGVDGSPESLAAAHWAADEALRREVPLRLVHAWPWLSMESGEVPDKETRRYWGERLLHDAESELTVRHPGLEVSTEQVSATAAEALVPAAEGASVLVLGSRGLSTFAGFMVGSVGLQVLARAACPVVLVRAPREDAGPAGAAEVLVGVDTGQEYDEVLGFAFEAAARRGAPLRALRAWSLPTPYGFAAVPWGPEFAGELEAEAKKELAAALRPWREKFPEVPVVEQVSLGAAALLLSEAAGRAGLVVVGRRVRQSPLGAHLGPVAHGVIHHAPCPVAVVPHH